MFSKKIFRVKELIFNLPDDFNGTTGDALLLMSNNQLEAEKNRTNIKGVTTNEECKNHNTLDLLLKNKSKKCYYYTKHLNMTKMKKIQKYR